MKSFSSRTAFYAAATVLISVCLLPAFTSTTDIKATSRSKRSTSSYLNAAAEVDTRLETILKQLHYNIPIAIESVEADIAEANRNRAILGLANWLGMTFGIAAGSDGNPNFGQLNEGQQIQVIAQALYGYGYWGPFLLAFEDARLTCGVYDLDAVLGEYGFLTDMNHNYGYLESYNGNHPKSVLSDVNDPYVLQFYATELNHAMKRALYCLVSKKGDNQQALEINTLIDLYTQLLEERLSITNEAMDTYENRV